MRGSGTSKAGFRGSSLSTTVPFATVRIKSDGSFHRSVTEQLTLDVDMPAVGPTLVVTVEDADAVLDPDAAFPQPELVFAGLGEVLAQVLDFHVAFDLPREPMPTSHVSDSLGQLRVRLLREEVEEFADAVERRDLIAVADALADVVYVAYGAAVTYGLDLDAVVREVHRSNMSKLDSSGRPILREDGKVLKSERYRPPDISRVIGEQLPLFALDTSTSADSSTVVAS